MEKVRKVERKMTHGVDNDGPLDTLRPGKTQTAWRMKSAISFTLLLLLPSLLSPVSALVRINEGGGYEELVVSIGKEVPPIACQQLIQNIQGIFTSASNYLFGATDGKVYFHRIVIVVPTQWDTRACGRSLPPSSFTSRSRVNDATVRVGMEHPVFGHQPWTQQSRPCGSEGDFISVGYHYLLAFNDTENAINGNGATSPKGNGIGNDNESSYEGLYGHAKGLPTERAFVREWAKYRYGVFDELGYPNDPIYPTSYVENGETRPTACTNAPLRGNWSVGCNESSGKGGNANGNATCKFVPSSSHENDRITSSVMSVGGLRKVRHFCDSTNHNRNAPTKQNFLCERKSVSDVIYSHQDFRNLNFREPNVPAPSPEFIVKQITQPRFVLLVEETGNMNLRDVWKFLKLAVRKFIKYDLPTGSQIGLITVSTNDVRVLANMTSVQSGALRRALADKLPNYPNVDSGGNISLRRGIFQAIELLKRNGQKAAGAVIILISTSQVSNSDLETSIELVRQEEVTVAAIEYPSLGDGKISQLSEGTNGPHFEIRETGVGPTTHLGCFVSLINALMNIQKFFTEDVAASWPSMIHHAEYKGDSRSYIEANFSFESTAAQSPAEFFIYTSNPNDPKINSVELTSPNGHAFTTQLSDLHDINVIKIDALINEPGVWRYRIERLADSHQSHFVQVVTKTTAEDLAVKLYTNVNPDKVANLSSTPLVIYTEVKRKNSPVIDADVEATIVTGNKKWTVRLLDNGNGDPDVTRGDGVYSRYFIVPPGVSASQLEISARIVVNPYRARFIVVSQEPLGAKGKGSWVEKQSPCCGSTLSPADPKGQYKIVPFGERSSNSVFLRISDIPPLGFYPPARIGGLKVKRPPHGRNITLTWTAPGDSLDQGVPASYQVLYSEERTEENWNLLQEFTGDLEAGVETEANLTLPRYGTFLLAVRAVDFYMKAGKMSNLVKVGFSPPPKDDEGGILSGGGGNSLGITGSTTPSSSNDELTKFDLMLILICGVSFVILLAGLIVVLLYCRKVGSSHRKSGKGPKGPETKISAITDPKSPIHWSASELLGEHEKRHSLYGGSVSPQGSENKPGQHQTYDGNPPNPMSLNILPQEYNGSNRSRSSPDSYDDPDSPTPIPISVRGNRSEYSVCIGDGYGHHVSHYPHHHYQTPMNGGPVHLSQQGQQHGFANSLSGGNVSRFSVGGGAVPPHSTASHLMHYDPDLQGSLSSVNSKKRNITMV